ncbi:hypothetical protein [Pleionea mediterranea]|uniref:Uncharacterized protein n=1 Tax=Pleionea mediterranea TaxID=523701 RepID=A0A316FKG0_9GAMM|nr:hypothetical protein [Pleionea mediterranea]PWK48602.1 hypothetical protein C8D97_109153 [Pleionea mediterranea]
MTTVGAISPYLKVKPLLQDLSANKTGLQQPSHHFLAYKALWQSLSRRIDLYRRQQLDSWLKQHQYSMSEGEQWELQILQQSNQTSQTFIDWSAEYFEVVIAALQSGLFYSDAFQKQLFHSYIETGRITLAQQNKIHQQAIVNGSQESIASYSSQANSQDKNRYDNILGILSMATITLLSISFII